MKYEINRPLAIYQLGKRENQEDSLYPSFDKATSDDRLFILCDGMGGHEKGEVASQTVCQEISEFVKSKADRSVPFTDSMLGEAMQSMYQVLNEKSRTTGDQKMGTTLVFLYFHAGGVMAAHIGDSRYYHIRPKTRSIVYRSKDHSLVNQLLEVGQITQAEVSTMKGKNVILRAVMPNQETPAQPDIVHIKDVRPGDWFYMCSDGMLEQMDDDELLNIICNDEMTDDQKRNCLLAATDENKDNHSAYLIHVSGVMHEIIDEDQPDDEAQMAMPVIKEDEEDKKDVAAVVESEPEVVVEPKYVDASPQSAPMVYPSPKSGNKSLWITMAVASLFLAIGAGTYFALRSPDKEKESEPVQPSVIVPATMEDDGVGTISNDADRQEEHHSAAPSRTKPATVASKLKNIKPAVTKGKNSATSTDDNNKITEEIKKAISAQESQNQKGKSAIDKLKSGKTSKDPGSSQDKTPKKKSGKKGDTQDDAVYYQF